MAFSGTQYTELKANALPGKVYGDFSGKVEVTAISEVCNFDVTVADILDFSETVADILDFSETVTDISDFEVKVGC